MHKKVKVSEKELEAISGGHERCNGRMGSEKNFICSKCGATCYIPNCESTTRWEGCDGVVSIKCDKCGTWDDLH